MSRHHRAGLLSNIRAFELILAFYLAALPLPVVGQPTEPSSEFDFGIVVTRAAEQASGILKKLNAGWDFGVLARVNSIDPSAEQGGYLGRLRPDQLRPELRDALIGVKPGQCSAVVQTSTGFARSAKPFRFHAHRSGRTHYKPFAIPRKGLSPHLRLLAVSESQLLPPPFAESRAGDGALSRSHRP